MHVQWVWPIFIIINRRNWLKGGVAIAVPAAPVPTALHDSDFAINCPIIGCHSVYALLSVSFGVVGIDILQCPHNPAACTPMPIQV